MPAGGILLAKYCLAFHRYRLPRNVLKLSKMHIQCSGSFLRRKRKGGKESRAIRKNLLLFTNIVCYNMYTNRKVLWENFSLLTVLSCFKLFLVTCSIWLFISQGIQRANQLGAIDLYLSDGLERKDFRRNLSKWHQHFCFHFRTARFGRKISWILKVNLHLTC